MDFDEWLLRSLEDGQVGFIKDMTTYVEKINGVFLIYEYKGVGRKIFYSWTHSIDEVLEEASEKIEDDKHS